MKILCTLAGVGIGVTAYIYHDGSAIQMEKPELKSEFQRERLSDDTMKQIFEERKFRLEKFCEKNHPNRKMKSWDERPSHIYVADVDLGMFWPKITGINVFDKNRPDSKFQSNKLPIVFIES